MNPIIEEICNGRHDMLIGVITVAIITGCATFLLRMFFVRTKRKAAFKSLAQDMKPDQETDVSPMPQKVPWDDMSKDVRKEILSVREQIAAKSQNAVAIKAEKERIELKTLKLAGIRLDIEIAIESKKLDLKLLVLENKIAALKQPSPKAQASAPAPLRRPMQTRNMADVENGFDTDFDQDPVPGPMFPDDDRLDLVGMFQNSVAIQ